MRSLTTMRSPFVDSHGEEIYDGNLVMADQFFSLWTYRVVYERGCWWLYDLSPFYIDNANRYKRLNESLAATYVITDDTVRLA